MERIEKLRRHALEVKINNDEWAYYYAKGFREGCKESEFLQLRYAHAVRYMLSHVSPAIDEGELIVGKPSNRALTETEAEELRLFRAEELAGFGSSAHMAVDYPKLLALGTEGIRAEIGEKLGGLDPLDPEDLKKRNFYESAKIALEGLEAFAENYAAHAEALAAKCGDAPRAEELRGIAQRCRRVPRFPAQNFRDALQSIHTLTVCLSMYPYGLYQYGRPDRYLIGFYRRDVRAGILDEQTAQEWIDCLCILPNELIVSGLAVGFMVGGRDAEGKDTSNELTELFLRSIGDTRMIYPGIGLAWHKDMPEKLLELSCELLGKGYSHPAIFNDELIVNGLKACGVPAEEAADYVQSTCVEITPCGSSSCWVASPYINTVQILLDVLGIRREGSEPAEFESMEQLLAAYYARLGERIRECWAEFDARMYERTQHFYQPLHSCFVNDCIARGEDIESGGARYNWIMPSFVGVSNLADSFRAIEKFVFEEGSLTFPRLAQMLEKDFAGEEAWRLKLLNLAEKYGNDDDIVDHYVLDFTEWLKKFVQPFRNVRGGRMVPSMFCWIMHDFFGQDTMATPDGRRCGFPLGDGSGPAQGREHSGPTASVLSSTKWDHSAFIGGIAVNMKFGKKLFKRESLPKLASLIKTFLQRGGFEMQINVVDAETLARARENPENYADLVVRIGGYSDYFVRLSDTMQREVMERTAHLL